MSGSPGGILYDSLTVHRSMLRDRVRTDAYREAIFRIVRPGAVVLDVGAGTGILSFFAAQAGAKRVFAVEAASVAEVAQELAARNGFSGVVHVVRGDIANVRLPTKVDVLVSEWLGAFGVDENFLRPVLVARDRWLGRGGRMVPSRVDACMAPVWTDRTLASDFFSTRPYDLDLAPLAEHGVAELASVRPSLAADAVQAAPRLLWSTDLLRFEAARAHLPFRASLRFTLPAGSRMDALAAWFRAELAPGVTLTNAPGRPPTHWGQQIFPIAHAVAFDADTEVAVVLTCIPSGPGYSHQAWSVRIGHREWEHHDSRSVPSEPGRGNAFRTPTPTITSTFQLDQEELEAPAERHS